MYLSRCPLHSDGVCLRARAQLFKDSTWLRSLHGIPLEAAISAAHPHRNLARCSAMRRRGRSSGGDGIWTLTESFERSLQARAPHNAHLRRWAVKLSLVHACPLLLSCAGMVGVVG